MAFDYGYPELAKKNESYEICFVPDNDYRGFLKRRVDGLEDRVAGGNFVDKHGKILGQHKGYPFYTIGQRKGLDIAFGKPVFVTKIDPVANTVVLGNEDDLDQNEMTVGKINMIKYDTISSGMEAITKIRYKDKGALSNLYPIAPFDTGHALSAQVRFYENVKGIAPGQSAVFYEGDDVIGGAELRQLRLVHFAARHRREPIVATAVGIERSEQAVALNRLTHATKAARCAFLFNEEHAVVLTGGIVHRHNQVPEMARHPFMSAAVLVDERPRHRRTFPTLAVWRHAAAAAWQPPHRPATGSLPRCSINATAATSSCAYRRARADTNNENA